MTLRITGGPINVEWESGSFGLWDGNRRIGHLHYVLFPSMEGVIYLTDLVIEQEEERKKGYGRMLLEHFETVARDQGFREVILFVVKQESLGFWRRMGYEGSYGVGKGFFKKLRTDATGTT